MIWSITRPVSHLVVATLVSLAMGLAACKTSSDEGSGGSELSDAVESSGGLALSYADAVKALSQLPNIAIRDPLSTPCLVGFSHQEFTSSIDGQDVVDSYGSLSVLTALPSPEEDRNYEGASGLLPKGSGWKPYKTGPTYEQIMTMERNGDLTTVRFVSYSYHSEFFDPRITRTMGSVRFDTVTGKPQWAEISKAVAKRSLFIWGPFGPEEKSQCQVAD